MRVLFDPSASIVLQHTASTDFNGTEVGRASVSNGAGASKLTFQARYLGAYANSTEDHYQVAVLAMKANASTFCRFDSSTFTLTVFVRTNAAGTILATADEVAASVNHDNRLPLVCSAGGTGVVAAFGPSNLAGGVNPTILGNTLTKFPSQAHCGLFYFNQGDSLVVRQIEAQFTSSVDWSIVVENLDEGLAPIVGEDVVLSVGTGTNVALWNLNYVLSPFRAIALKAVKAGVARVVVHREPNYPHL